MAVATEMTGSVMSGSVVPGSMMTRFGVKNYKCLKDVDIPLTPIHVIIGQNDAGKTSLLEAMLAFFRSSKQQISEAFPGKWKGNELLFEGAETPAIEFSAGFHVVDGNKQADSDLEYG